MNMKMKRNITAISALAILVSAITSCATDTDTPTTGMVDITSDTDAKTEVVTEAPRPSSNLPEMDFGGAVYRISANSASDAAVLVVEQLNGDSVNDILYERNANLCDTYNFELSVEHTNDDYNAHNKLVSTAVLAGDDAWELVCGHCVVTCNNAVDGIFLNLHELPYLDFSKPWWAQQAVEQMTFNEKMFTTTSNWNYMQLAFTDTIAFNKEILTAHDIPFPYDSVRNGEWTFDTLISQTKDMYHDVNGDGTRDMKDQYGFVTNPEQTSFLTSCDAQVIGETSDGGLEFTVLTDKMTKMVEKHYAWYYETNDVYLSSFRFGDDDFTARIFANGNTAFAYSSLYYATSFYRDANISYGIVPLPKYDKEQEHYYSFTAPSLYSVPLSCQNTELAGFVLEAMSYYGYYDVLPAYYELMLQGKIADSPDDVEMLDIIKDSMTASFAYCYDNWQGFAHLLGERMRFNRTSGNKDLASAYEKYKKSAQKRLDKVLAGFADELS